MGTYILRRLLLMIPTLLGMTFLVFMIVASSPQGIGASLTVSAGGQMEATSRAVQEAYLQDRYGLDDPAPVQYVRWLGRISPIKFGTRDQATSAGERIGTPKPLDQPPLLDWFDSIDMPGTPAGEAYEFPPEAAPAPDMDDDQRNATRTERARIYRIASNRYAKARARYVATRSNFDVSLADVLREHGHERAVKKNGQLIVNRARRIDPAPFKDQLVGEITDNAEAMTDAYADALTQRAHLAAVFAARPFKQVGLAIPGVPVTLASPDLGKSFSRSRPVSKLILEALPRTLLLNVIAIPVIYLIAIPSGMLASARQGKLFDVLSGALFVALWSIPIVWAGVLAIGFLANDRYLGWFPVIGLHDSNAEAFTFLPTTLADGSWHRGFMLDTLWHMVLPVACLTYGGFAVLAKQTRAAMLDNFSADYVRTAKAKGVTNRTLVFAHVFRNSLLPLITMFVSIFPWLLSGSVIIERIFSIQGMGSLVLEAIYLGDRELLLANVFVIGMVNMLALLLADILYAMADPRITYD